MVKVRSTTIRGTVSTIIKTAARMVATTRSFFNILTIFLKSLNIYIYILERVHTTIHSSIYQLQTYKYEVLSCRTRVTGLVGRPIEILSEE